MKKQAVSILNQGKLIHCGENHHMYKHFKQELGYAKIDTVGKTCTFHKFFNKELCKHLVSACLKDKVSLPGLVQLPSKFRIKRRDKIKKLFG